MSSCFHPLRSLYIHEGEASDMSALLIVANRLNSSTLLKAKVPVAKQFLVVAKQAAEPSFIVVSQVGGSDQVLLSGQSEYPRERIQIEVVAEDYHSAREIMDLVRLALAGLIKETIPSLNVRDVDITYTGFELTTYSDKQE